VRVLDAKTASVIKERAEGLYSKGRLEDALAAFRSIEAHGTEDPRILLRTGDIARRLGDTALAVESYKLASEAFAALGFTIKAIAVCKMIAQVDPGAEGIDERLAELSARGGGEVPAAARAAADKPKGDEAATVAKASDDAVTPDAAVTPEELPRVPLFSDFTEAEFLGVVRKVRAVRLEEGEFLFAEGDPGDSIYFVAEGALDVVGRGRDGAEHPYATLADGDVFGEFGFFHNTRRSAGVRAREASEVLELTRADLDEIVSTHERVSEILFEFYKERVVDTLMALSAIFSPMSAEDRREALARAEVERFNAGDTIVAEGERGEKMYLVKSGHVTVSVGGGDTGGSRVIAELEPGDLFGEIAVALARPRVATVTARTGVEVIGFSRAVIKEILGRYGSVKELLERVVKERVGDVIKARGELGGRHL